MLKKRSLDMRIRTHDVTVTHYEHQLKVAKK